MPSVFDQESEIDTGTLFGIIAAFGLIAIAIFLGSGASVFFDLNSAFIVLGGTLGATLINFPLDELLRVPNLVRTAFFPDSRSGQYRISRLIELSEKARSEGVAALQTDYTRESDPFFRKALGLAADGLTGADIRRILEFEITFLVDRHRRGAQLFATMGAVAPAMGLLGTVIGLIQMLKGLNESDSIGPAMAVALVTTFYGSVLANLLFLPLAGKLRARSEEERRLRQMTVEGVVNIAEKMNPRINEECLLSFLPPDLRRSKYG